MATEDKKDQIPAEDQFFSLPRIYVNAAKVTRGYHDFQVLFGTTCSNVLAEETYQAVIPQSIVHMSPQHFKALTKIFIEQLDRYEKEIGVIPEPPKPPDSKDA